MIVLGELVRIEDFFMTAHCQGTPIVDIYQHVQGDTNICLCMCKIEEAA